MTDESVFNGLEENRATRILFVCSGNTCRSFMAAALLQNRVDRGDAPRLDVRSVGTAAVDGAPAAAGARQVLAARGIEIEHEAAALNDEMVNWASLILTMTREHRTSVLRTFPEARGKVYVLGQWAASERWTELIEEGEALYEDLGRRQDEVRQNQAAEVNELERRRLGLNDGDRDTIGRLADVDAELERLAEQAADAVREERRQLGQVDAALEALEVKDPVGGGMEAYEATAARLENLLNRLVDRFAAHSGTNSKGDQG